jgi:hypothetical protein
LMRHKARPPSHAASWRVHAVCRCASSARKLLIENFAAGQIAAVKKLILMRGYLDDLETLAPDDTDSGAADGQ